MATDGSDAGDRSDEPGAGGPSREGVPRAAPPARPLPPPPSRAVPPAPQRKAAAPVAAGPRPAPSGEARLSLTDLDVPTRERPALAPATAADAPAGGSLLDLDVPTRERPAVPARPPNIEAPVPPAQAMPMADVPDAPVAITSAPGSQPRAPAAAFASSDSIGMLESPTSEPRTVELELPPDVAEALQGTATAAQPASVPGAPEPEPKAKPEDEDEPSDDESTDDSFLSSASLKAEEARRLVAENAARVRQEREAEERAVRERARQSRQPETLEQKRQRLVLRMRTVREGIRLLGFMSISDSARALLDQGLAELEQALVPDAGDARQDPASLDAAALNLDAAGTERVERPLSQLEDLALQVDASVPLTVFRERAFAGKHNRKALTRYGRLLASRRFSADLRRDRFENLATQLLAQPDATGRLVMLPKEQARTVLQHLIGGLPQVGSERDREDAITYLKDALTRLAEFESAEALFDGGFFLDVHGYKVSMRDQLTSPDFLYLSALLNARLHNRLEDWIDEKEKSRKANQLTQDGSPRERIMGMLREQEETVRNIFGAPAPAPVSETSIAKRPPPKKAAKDAGRDREKEKDKWRKRKARLAAQRSGETPWQKVAALAAVIVVSALIVLRSTGHLDLSGADLVDPQTLSGYSPMLVRGYVQDQTLYAVLNLAAWEKLDEKQRREAATSIALKLSAVGVEKAEIKAHRNVAISVEASQVVYVQSPKSRRKKRE